MDQDTLKTGFDKMNIIIVLQRENEKKGVVMRKFTKWVHVIDGCSENCMEHDAILYIYPFRVVVIMANYNFDKSCI